MGAIVVNLLMVFLQHTAGIYKDYWLNVTANIFIENLCLRCGFKWHMSI